VDPLLPKPVVHLTGTKAGLTQVGQTTADLLEAQGSDVGFDNHDAKIAFLATVGRLARVEFHEHEQATEGVVAFDPETENPIDLQKEGWQSILNSFKAYSEAQG